MNLLTSYSRKYTLTFILFVCISASGFSQCITLYTTQGGGSTCGGTRSVTISLTYSSQVGVNYNLILNGIETGPVLAGNGTPLNFSVTSTGTYQIIAKKSGCSSLTMTGSAVVNSASVPVPTIAVSGTGCSTILTGGGGATYAWRYNSSTGSVISTSSTLAATKSGTYYLTATSSCGNSTQTSVNVNTITPISISPSSAPVNICPGVFTLTASGGTNYSWTLPNSTTSTAGVLTPTLAGTYTLTGTNTCGVQETTTIPITVNGTATSPSASNKKIGYNISTVLTATGAQTGENYSWYNSSLFFLGTGAYTTPLLTGNTSYYVSKTSNTLCESSKVPLIVTVNKLPVPNAGVDIVLVLPSNQTTLSGLATDPDGDALTYSWSFISGGTYSATGSATATLSLTNLKSGPYVFRLSTNDGLNTTYDDVLVTVNYPPNNYNYIKHQSVAVSGVQDPNSINGMAIGSKLETWNYFDGLGRSTQAVSTQNSFSKKDVVQAVVYDDYGREKLKYLPFVSTENTGSLKVNPVGTTSYVGSTHNLFYTNGTTDKVIDDSAPFAETRFESSPLNRVIEQGSVGSAWQPDGTDSYTSTDKTTKKSYLVNDVAEVLLFEYVDPNATYPLGTVKIGNTTYYKAGQLFKNSTKDEEGNEVIEYSDKDNRIVLKKVMVTVGSYAQTYYVYDDFGNRVHVIQPEGVKSILAATPITWANKGGTTAVGVNDLKKSASSGYGNAGPTSTIATETLAAGVDGWVEMIAGETNLSRMIGLANSGGDNGFTITYALELNSDGKIYIWEGGIKGVSLGNYVTGTVVRISREGTQVKYYVDGVYKQLSSFASTGTLIVDAALSDQNSTLQNVTMSFKVNVSLAATLTNFAFQYSYDARRRATQKQIPGTDPIYMVYDNFDRLVLTQSGNQRKDASGVVNLTNWLYTKYDILNRPIITGLYTHGAVLDQAGMQNYVNTQIVSGNQFYEDSNTDPSTHGYTNRMFPKVNCDVFTVTYYDNYAFRSLFGSTEYNFKADDLPPDNTNGYPGQITTPFNGTLGQITGLKTKILGANTFLKSVVYYDFHYRPIQTIVDNIKGYFVSTSVYDFMGKALRTKSSLYQGQPVTWSNITGVQVTGDVLSSTGTTSWSQGATSTQTLPPNTDGWAEITVNNSNPEVEFGLVDTYVSPAIVNIDYGWYLNKNQLLAYENGTQVWSSTNVNPGDVLRIERINGAIYYKRNGLVYYKSLVSSTTALMVQVSFKNSGSKMLQGRVSNTFTGSPAAVATSYFVKRFDYDHTGRLLKTWHTVKGNTEVLLAYNVYNELGQLVDKKLYNTDAPSVADNSRVFKQSVDFRFNIRGWLTSINNAALIPDATNDETNDFFGMNLNYEQADAGESNTGLYNGNISGMKWSSNLGLGDIKQISYNFTYDGLNRMINANSRMNKTNSWQTGYYDEKGLSYDLNGNIKTLKRSGELGAAIDDLTYSFGTGVNASNKLLSVTDGTLVVKGFSDGNTSGNDYSYDWNGNLLTDKNKGLTVPIVYNHLDLVTSVVRSYSNINYIYDATGTKQGQVATYGTAQKFTEYVGPWNFENNELQFLQHDEGRVVLTNQQKMYTSTCDVATELTGTQTIISLAPYAINGEEYIQVTPTIGNNLSKIGVTQIGTAIPVAEGERYMFRVKGYNNGSATANLYVKNNTNSTDILWPGAPLPYQAVNESWVEESFTIPAGVTQIVLGVVFNSSATASASNIFYINEIEVYKKSTLAPEYQYNLKDHLGNVRLTFTTKPIVTQSITATFETAAQSTEVNQFLNYPISGGKISTNSSYAHGGSTNSHLLNGAYNNKVGVAKSYSVMPGDVVSISAYAKYETPTSSDSNPTAFITTLLAAFSVPAPVPNEAGTASAGLNSWGTTELAGNGDVRTDLNIPKVFVTIVIFDKNYNVVDLSYQQLKSTGDMSASCNIKQAGYAYAYVSNEQSTLTNVYIDDVTISFTPSAIIAGSDYYPFGLTFNSYSRENSVKQDFQYNGKEIQDELDLCWLDYGARMYDPAVGRWMVKDPLTELSRRWSPYTYAYNNPIRFIDPDGMYSTEEWKKAHGVKDTDVTNVYTAGDGGMALFVSYPDANPAIPSNQGLAKWGEKTFSDGDGKVNAGHAGVVLINDKGETSYFDFGRYDQKKRLGERGENYGSVRSSRNFPSLKVPKWNFKKTDNENINAILTKLHSSPLLSDYGRIVGALAKNLNYSSMLTYARKAEDEGYLPFGGYGSGYDYCDNATYCAKFARAVGDAGGFDWDWDTFTGIGNVEDVNDLNKAESADKCRFEGR